MSEEIEKVEQKPGLLGALLKSIQKTEEEAEQIKKLEGILNGLKQELEKETDIEKKKSLQVAIYKIDFKKWLIEYRVWEKIKNESIITPELLIQITKLPREKQEIYTNKTQELLNKLENRPKLDHLIDKDIFTEKDKKEIEEAEKVITDLDEITKEREEIEEEAKKIQLTPEDLIKASDIYVKRMLDLRIKYLEEKKAREKAEAEVKKYKDQVKKQGLEVAEKPKKIEKITRSLWRNTPFKETDFRGFFDFQGERKAKWSKENLTALIPAQNTGYLTIGKKANTKDGYLIPPPPKVAVSQAKNIDTLIYLLYKENKKRVKQNLDKVAGLEFTFKDYAKVRGYNEQELARGGSFNNELKRDLISGGITSYILELEKSYIINNFYGIEIPKEKSQGKWIIEFNSPYSNMLLNNDKDYYPILLKAIQDKSTNDKKGYLYFFLREIFTLKNNPEQNFKTQTKIINLLNKIQMSRANDRPGEAFKVLAECITYVASLKDILQEVRFLKTKDGGAKIITDLSIFKSISYEQFRDDYLRDLRIEDIRDALISFNTIALKLEPEQEVGPGAEQETEHKNIIEGEFTN